MARLILIYFVLIGLSVHAQFTVSVASSHATTLTCKLKRLVMTASSNHSRTPAFTWFAPGGFVHSGFTFTIGTPGAYTLAASDGTLKASKSFTIYSNTAAPVPSAPPAFTISPGTPYTFISMTPTTYVLQYIVSPSGFTQSATSATMFYKGGTPGTYTYCVEDLLNGCISCGSMVICSVCGPDSVTTGISGAEKSYGLRIGVKDGSVIFDSPYDCVVSITGCDGIPAAEVILKSGNRVIKRLNPGVYIIRENYTRRKTFKLLVQ